MVFRFRLVPALAASVLAPAACGASDEAPSAPGAAPVESTLVTEPTATESPPTSEPVATSEDPVPETSEPATSEPATTEPAPPANERSCLIGAWAMTQEEMNGYYGALTAALDDGPTVDIEIAGQTLLTFTETEYTYVADFDLVLSAAGLGGTGVSSGTVSGTWEVVDERVVTTLDSSDLDVVITVAGTTINGSDFANGLLDSVPINDAPFDCEGPTLGFQIDDSGDLRHDVALTPV